VAVGGGGKEGRRRREEDLKAGRRRSCLIRIERCGVTWRKMFGEQGRGEVEKEGSGRGASEGEA